MNYSATNNEKKISQFFIRHYLGKAILKQIFLRPQTRASLIEFFRVRPNTISEHISELLQAGMIVPSEPIKTGGRDLVTLKINNDHSFYAGIIIEGEKIKGVVVGLAGEAVYQYSMVNPQPSGSKEFVENIAEVVSHLLNHSRRKIESICFSGEHFSEGNHVYHSDYIAGYAAADFLPRIKKLSALRCKFQSGIYSKIMAERWFGKGRGVDNFAFINIGTGVSAGVVHKSILNQGAYQIGGQLGHSRRFSEKKCRCGRIGCLETVASVWAVKEFLEKNRDILGETRSGKLHTTPLTEILSNYLDSILQQQNRKAMLHLKKMARHWAVAIRNVVDLLAPGKIIVGGTMLQARNIILPIIESEINSRLFPFEEKHIPVEVSELGEYNGAIGAATFLLEELYSIPEPEYYFELI